MCVYMYVFVYALACCAHSVQHVLKAGNGPRDKATAQCHAILTKLSPCESVIGAKGVGACRRGFL